MSPKGRSMNPGVVRLRGKTFIARGELIEVEEGITLQEACRRYPPSERKTKDKKVKTETQKPETKEYQVLSSKGDKSYTVTLRDHLYSCSCPGYGWRRKCRHIESVKI